MGVVLQWYLLWNAVRLEESGKTGDLVAPPSVPSQAFHWQPEARATAH